MSLLTRLKDALEIEREINGVAKRKVERWMEYDVAWPSEECAGHEKVWTGAPGVWHCRDCVEWYRVWEDAPYRPERQKEGW